MSQIVFPLAAVLVVSSVLKLVAPISWPERLATVFEGSVGIAVIVSSQQVLPIRLVTLIVMTFLYGLYLGYVAKDLKNSRSSPCICFGKLSTKPARPFSVARNALLFVGSFVSCFSAQSGLGAMGLFLTVLVLGAILFEEIR